MNILALNNITRKPMLISYRKEYHADVVLGIHAKDETMLKIEFSIEMTPLGEKLVRIQFLQDVHYPIVPILRDLKSHIVELERARELP